MKILGQEIKFRGWRIVVRQDRLIGPSGREITRDIVLHPGAVSIVARPTPDSVILIRQYRHAVGEEIVELPAGTLEEGEDPAETARRELEEETGYSASTLTPHAVYYTTPGFTNETMHLYEATGLTAGSQALEDDEAIEVAVTPSAEALRMIRDGKIRDAKTILGLLLVLNPR